MSELDARPAAIAWRPALRIVWAVVGVPTVAIIFAIVLTVLFPIGGGIAHLMFAYSNGGNLGGERIVFCGFVLATLLATGFLRWTRYPGAWYVRASVVSIVALWMWLPAPLSDAAGRPFRLQGLALAVLLPCAAFLVARWGDRRRRSAAPPSNDR